MGILDDIMRQAEDEYRRENDSGYEAWKAMQRALHSDEPTMTTSSGRSLRLGAASEASWRDGKRLKRITGTGNLLMSCAEKALFLVPICT